MDHYIVTTDPTATVLATACGLSIPTHPIPEQGEAECPTCRAMVDNHEVD